jgi:hypothetical protein
MLDVREPAGGDFVDFYTAGMPAKGQFQCAECGYGITIHTELPRCPMCSGDAWETVAWSPFTRSLAAELND